MSDWSSFEGDKEFADAWRAFLNETDVVDCKIELNEGFMSAIGSAAKAAGGAASKMKGGASKIGGLYKPGGKFYDPRGSAAKRALKMARGINFAGAATGGGGGAGEAAGSWEPLNDNKPLAPAEMQAAKERINKMSEMAERVRGRIDDFLRAMPSLEKKDFLSFAAWFHHRQFEKKDKDLSPHQQALYNWIVRNYEKTRVSKEEVGYAKIKLGFKKPPEPAAPSPKPASDAESAPEPKPPSRAERRAAEKEAKSKKKKPKGRASKSSKKPKGPGAPPSRGRFGEQLDLSLEDLIKEELLRVLNEEE